MTHPARHPVHWLLLCALGGLAISAATTGCSSSGHSPNCPPLPLYDVRDASNSPSVVAAQKASANKGCYTLLGHATSGDSGGGSGGSPPVDAGGG